MKRYTDFEIWIDLPAAPPGGGSAPAYPVRVTTSLAGSASGTLELDVADQGFLNKLSVVRDMGPDLSSRQAFGQRLFEALFRDRVRDAWMTSRGRVDAGEADGLRLRLCINDPQVATLPWELMYEEGKGFLATAANLALSRYLPVPEPPAFTTQERLRILVVVESPSNLPQIDAQEIAKLEGAFADLGSSVEHTLLQNPATPQIQNALQQGYHVLHFLGHGRAGKLALTEAGGTNATYITDQQFAQLVQGRSSLRLVVLNACYSSQPADGELFAGMGPSLVKMQMPAVVAMHYHTVAMDTAGRFSQAFYGALANGVPVDFAVNEARQQLSAGELLEQRDWSTPVLYMGTRQGRILDLVDPKANETELAWHSVALAVQDSDVARANLAQLTGRLQRIVEQQRTLAGLVELEDHLRDVRAEFGECEQTVQQAGSPAALGPKLAKFKQAWTRLQSQQLAPLWAFLDGHPEIEATAPVSPLKPAFEAIDTSLQKIRLGDLVAQVPQLGTELDGALAAVREKIRNALGALQTLSDATLGPFALHESL
jgi:hypothetical protein